MLAVAWALNKGSEKQTSDKGNFLWNWRGWVKYVAALIMSLLEEGNCLQGQSGWCFNCIQITWGFFPQAFWSSVHSAVWKAKAVSPQCSKVMWWPQWSVYWWKYWKRTARFNGAHLIPKKGLLSAPALGEDACCSSRLPLSSLVNMLVEDQFVDVYLWKASWASQKQKMVLLV